MDSNKAINRPTMLILMLCAFEFMVSSKWIG